MKMTPRERVMASVNHQNPDSLPMDLGSNVSAGISGMASRDLKKSELEQGLKATVIATDGIAVIVNKDNKVGDLKKEQVEAIFTGKITEWNKL